MLSSLAISFLRGIDSTYLIGVRMILLGDKMIAVRQIKGLRGSSSTGAGSRQIVVQTNELKGSKENPPDSAHMQDRRS